MYRCSYLVEGNTGKTHREVNGGGGLGETDLVT
jgi:hypothetical protein